MKTYFNKNSRKNLVMICFVAPALILVLNTTLIPFVMNVFYSFTKWNGVGSQVQWAGLTNYIRLFTRDKRFWQYLIFTFRFMAYFVVLVNVLALGIAHALAKKTRLNNAVRAGVFLPYVISMIAVGLIWKFIFGTGFESLAELLNWPFLARGWLSEKDLVMGSIIITALWQNVGFFMVIYIAGLVSMPESVLEAARVDGASGWTQFFRIKLPLLAPSVTICLFYSITYSLKLFELLVALTKGGPGGLTTTIAYDIYLEAFERSRYGYATAKSVVFLLIVLVITLTQLKLSKKMEVEA